MALNSINDAINAYRTAARSVSTGGAGESGQAAGDVQSGGDFASLLKSGAQEFVDTAKKGEEMSKQALTGKADIRDVVAAVNNAELTLQTVVAVRDKVVSAYNDILRMPI